MTTEPSPSILECRRRASSSSVYQKTMCTTVSCSPGMFFLYGRDVTLTRSGGEAIDYGEILIPPNTVMADPGTGQIRPEWAKFLNDVRLRLNN